MAGPNDLQSLAGAAAQDIFSGQAAIGARSSVMSVADRNPDAEAKVQSQAQSLGVPYESARNNPQVVTQRAAANAVDYDNLARTAPVTTRFLGNPANAAVSHDDVGALGGIEHWISKAGSYFEQKLGAAVHNVAAVGAQALNDVAAGVANYGQVLSDPLGSAARALVPASSLMPPPTFNSSGVSGLQRFAVRQQQTANRIAQNADQGAGYDNLAYATTDPDRSAFLHPVKIVGDLLQGLPTLAALAASTYLTRGEGLLGAEAFGGYMGAGSQVDTLARLSDSDVQKSPAYRSLVNAGMDPATAIATVRNRTAADQGVASAAINATFAKLLEPFALSSGGSLWKGLGLDALSWGAMGGASQLGSNAVERADINPNKNLGDNVLEASVANFAQGISFASLAGSVCPETAPEQRR